MSKLKSSKKIEVDLDISEIDLTKAEAKATYAEIKRYALDKFGLKVSQLYIAQVKREFGENKMNVEFKNPGIDYMIERILDFQAEAESAFWR